MQWISLQLGWTSLDVIAIQILIGCAAAVGAIVISSVASFKTVQVASSVKRLRGSLINKQISVFCQWWSSIPCELTKAAVARRARAAKVMERNFMLRYDNLMSKKISLIYTHLLSVLSSFTMDVHNRHYLGFACIGVRNIAIIHFLFNRSLFLGIEVVTYYRRPIVAFGLWSW